MCRLCIVLAEKPSRPEGAGRSAAVSVGEVDWISEFDSVQFQHPRHATLSSGFTVHAN